MCGLEPPNAMYLLGVPFDVPEWFNIWVILWLSLALLFGICSIYEWKVLDEDDRWYKKLQEKKK